MYLWVQCDSFEKWLISLATAQSVYCKPFLLFTGSAPQIVGAFCPPRCIFGLVIAFFFSLFAHLPFQKHCTGKKSTLAFFFFSSSNTPSHSHLVITSHPVWRLKRTLIMICRHTRLFGDSLLFMAFVRHSNVSPTFRKGPEKLLSWLCNRL